MPSDHQNLDARLSARIKSERITRGWSLTDLTERSGVSRAMINKIERGQSSPTASLLGKLSGAFGLSLSTLLARAENTEPASLTRAKDQAKWIDPETGYIRTQIISKTDKNLPLDIIKVELPAGQSVAYSAASFTHLCQTIWVYEGKLIFSDGDIEHKLAAGDVLELGSPKDREFKNQTDTTCCYVVTVLRNHVNTQPK